MYFRPPTSLGYFDLRRRATEKQAFLTLHVDADLINDTDALKSLIGVSI